MRRVQAAALDLIEARGFDRVTIEEIAAAADSSPATVYRSFGTKERIVLWDDYDPRLFEAIAARLPGDPIVAVREALVVELDRIYERERARILRRAKLALAHPALVAANTADRAALRGGLAGLLRQTRTCRDVLEAEVVAGALASALEAAVEAWVRDDGRAPLRTVLRRAFDHLGRLGAGRAGPTRTPRARR